MTVAIYLPFNSPDLIEGAENFTGDNEIIMADGSGAKPLRRVGATYILYIFAHGCYSTGSEIAGVVPGRVWGTSKKTMTAAKLAGLLCADDLPLSFGDIRMLVCWGGYTGGSVANWGNSKHDLKRSADEAPFAGQLCSALKSLGYYRMIVTGYRGSVSYSGKGSTAGQISSLMVKDSNNNLMSAGSTFSQPPSLNSQLISKRITSPHKDNAGQTFLSFDDNTRTVWY